LPDKRMGRTAGTKTGGQKLGNERKITPVGKKWEQNQPPRTADERELGRWSEKHARGKKRGLIRKASYLS